LFRSPFSLSVAGRQIVGNPDDDFIEAPEAVAQQIIDDGKAVAFDDDDADTAGADDAAPIAPRAAAGGRGKGKAKAADTAGADDAAPTADDSAPLA